jgi:uncharacterized membrane protein
MAATTQQGKSFTLFMVGITATAAGIAFISSGTGKVALVIGVLAVAISLFGFLKIKPLEGVTAEGAQPAVMKLAGVGLALLGWLVVLIGLHLTASVSGRMTTTILGLVVSLAGVLFILPTASSKNAIWKA